MGVEVIFISAPSRFEWFNFQGKATRIDGATAENVKHLEFSVPTGFGPQNLIRSKLRNELEAIFISAPSQFEWFNFQGKATRTNGTTAENMKHLECSVPAVTTTKFDLVRVTQQAWKQSSSPHHAGGLIFGVKQQELLELQLKM